MEETRKRLLTDRPSLWQRLMCAVGLHAWQHSRFMSVLDVFPPAGMEPLRRQCFWCGKKQRWLPGYGGSEIGCWEPDWGLPTNYPATRHDPE
jgi:hypothetical protein